MRNPITVPTTEQQRIEAELTPRLHWEECGWDGEKATWYIAVEQPRSGPRRSFVVSVYRGDWELYVSGQHECVDTLAGCKARAERMVQ